MDKTIILEFSGNYRFLSNFYPSPIFIIDRIMGSTAYSTVEHYYQAQKSLNPHDRSFIIHNCASPGQAKKMGRTFKLRDDWEDVKLHVMKIGLMAKYSQHPDLMKLLLGTYPATLIEGNHWHDNFWGQCLCDKCGPGLNNLGLIHMSIRKFMR